MPESTPSFRWLESWPIVVGQEKRYDGRPAQSPSLILVRARPGGRRSALFSARRCLAPAPACSRVLASFPARSVRRSPRQGPPARQQQPLAVGTGQVKVGLILPLSAAGNAGVAAQSMKNAAEMALAEFQNPNVQLLIKDDGGSPQGASQGTQQALGEGAEIILGPLFAASVPATAQLTRARGISVIAFSTDSSVAGRGVYLLSFLPESDVNRIVDYAAGTGKRSFAALLPDNAYGNVVEAAFKQAVGAQGRPRRRVREIRRRSFGRRRAPWRSRSARPTRC